MTATFPKSRNAHCVALFEWPDGSAATTPMWGIVGALPHDLGHYVGEAQFRPPYGFWNLAAQQAPFASLTLVRGRWPGDRHEWLERIRRKHGVEMLKAEALDLSRLADRSIGDIDRHWPGMARRLRNGLSFTRTSPFDHATKADFVEARDRAIALNKAWGRVPVGGALIVFWPPDKPPQVVQRYEPPVMTPVGRKSGKEKRVSRR